MHACYQNLHLYQETLDQISFYRANMEGTTVLSKLQKHQC